MGKCTYALMLLAVASLLILALTFYSTKKTPGTKETYTYTPPYVYASKSGGMFYDIWGFERPLPQTYGRNQGRYLKEVPLQHTYAMMSHLGNMTSCLPPVEHYGRDDPEGAMSCAKREMLYPQDFPDKTAYIEMESL